MKSDRSIFEIKQRVDYSVMYRALEFFAERYDFISIGSIGHSVFDRNIPLIKLGKGEKRVIYIGSHHGSESITSGILLKFINEYCETFKRGGGVDKISIGELYNEVELNIIPMLNPDGVELSVNGLSRDNVLYDRLIQMNGGSEDFKNWNSNGRGVDLNHNYNYGFAEYKMKESEQGITGGAPTRFSGENPESEPETGYLCSYIRFFGDFCGAISLHSQGEEIYYKSGAYAPNGAERIAEYFGLICGYKPCIATGTAAYGGFTDWFINEFDRPSFTFECGKGENPLPIIDLPGIYFDLRRVLFEAPLILSRNRQRKG